jgi:hypothetical protein
MKQELCHLQNSRHLNTIDAKFGHRGPGVVKFSDMSLMRGMAAKLGHGFFRIGAGLNARDVPAPIDIGTGANPERVCSA